MITVGLLQAKLSLLGLNAASRCEHKNVMQNVQIIEIDSGKLLRIHQHGFQVGCVYQNGIVTNNSGTILGYNPYKGLAKLLGVDEKEVREAWPDLYDKRRQG
jgi:hypothetical protein